MEQLYEILSFSQAFKISRQYLLLRTVILQNIVAGCPWNIFQFHVWLHLSRVHLADDERKLSVDFDYTF